MPTPSAYMLNQRAVGALLLEWTNYLNRWRPAATIAHEHWQAASAARLDRVSHPEHPLDDCPLCSGLLGQGYRFGLPRPAALTAAGPGRFDDL